MGEFENMYADDVNFTELNLEIARFNRLVQWSATCGPFHGRPQKKMQGGAKTFSRWPS